MAPATVWRLLAHVSFSCLFFCSFFISVSFWFVVLFFGRWRVKREQVPKMFHLRRSWHFYCCPMCVQCTGLWHCYIMQPIAIAWLECAGAQPKTFQMHWNGEQSTVETRDKGCTKWTTGHIARSHRRWVIADRIVSEETFFVCAFFGTSNVVCSHSHLLLLFPFSPDLWRCVVRALLSRWGKWRQATTLISFVFLFFCSSFVSSLPVDKCRTITQQFTQKVWFKWRHVHSNTIRCDCMSQGIHIQFDRIGPKD